MAWHEDYSARDHFGSLSQTTEDAAPAAPPDCWRCRHFAMSWQPAMPYLCRRLGFKSRMLPCLEVVRADGRPCQGFEAKPVAA